MLELLIHVHDDNKFDVTRNFTTYIYEDTSGTRLKTLRLEHNLTIDNLSKELNISSSTLSSVEHDKIKVPYYYWKIICSYFNVNNIEYLQLYNMKEKTVQEKLIKLRAYIGARGWSDVGKYLGYSKGFVSDMLTRYEPNKNIINKIDMKLKEIKD